MGFKEEREKTKGLIEQINNVIANLQRQGYQDAGISIKQLEEIKQRLLEYDEVKREFLGVCGGFGSMMKSMHLGSYFLKGE